MKQLRITVLATLLLTAASLPACAQGPPPFPPDCMRVSGGVMASQIVNSVEPIYPPIAQAAHVSGAVVLHALIGTDGRVEQLEVISGPAMLRMAAIEAVRQWTYRPYLLNGRATKVDTTVTVIFQLASPPAPAGGPGGSDH